MLWTGDIYGGKFLDTQIVCVWSELSLRPIRKLRPNYPCKSSKEWSPFRCIVFDVNEKLKNTFTWSFFPIQSKCTCCMSEIMNVNDKKWIGNEVEWPSWFFYELCVIQLWTFEFFLSDSLMLLTLKLYDLFYFWMNVSINIKISKHFNVNGKTIRLLYCDARICFKGQ